MGRVISYYEIIVTYSNSPHFDVLTNFLGGMLRLLFVEIINYEFDFTLVATGDRLVR